MSDEIKDKNELEGKNPDDLGNSDALGHASPLHALLPYHIPVHSFGVMLSPGKLSAQSHSTSELLSLIHI